MAILNFLKTPKIREYHHEYIYYDPDKEAREERIKRIQRKKEAEKNNELYSPSLKQGVFTSQLKGNKIKSESKNLRIVMTLIVIAVIIYMIK